MPDGLDAIRSRIETWHLEEPTPTVVCLPEHDLLRLLAIAEAARHYVDGMAGDSPGALGDALDQLSR